MVDGDSHNSLTNIVNGSGFPLQITVEHLINSTFKDKEWQPLLREHPWRNESANTSGFIDLIVEDGGTKRQRLVIECKRVKDTQWIFLVPKIKSNARKVCRCWVTEQEEGGRSRTQGGWNTVTSPPATQISEFCIVQGHDIKSRPMLERVASDLVDATEALAHEELEHHFGQKFTGCYFPIIVTTAELKVCNFDPNKVNIKTGELVDPVYTSVPAVRFHKTLSVPSSKPGSTDDFIEKIFSSTKELVDIHGEAERTVLVVNANHLISYLADWR